MIVLILVLDHICMHLKVSRVSEVHNNGSGVSLHLELVQSGFQPDFYTYQSCGHFCFPCAGKNARQKQLVEERLDLIFKVRGTDHPGGKTRLVEIRGSENCFGSLLYYSRAGSRNLGLKVCLSLKHFLDLTF